MVNYRMWSVGRAKTTWAALLLAFGMRALSNGIGRRPYHRVCARKIKQGSLIMAGHFLYAVSEHYTVPSVVGQSIFRYSAIVRFVLWPTVTRKR